MSTTTIRRRYDKEMYSTFSERYYDQSGFFNFGYWTPETRTQREASANLVEKLLEYIPQKQGTILDVACGMGATTQQLLAYYDPSDVVGINISQKQLESSQENAPGCTFLLMDATKLDFADNTFDNVICVEAAFHFDTREAFLREAYRVLKPGGRLVLSDVILFAWSTRANKQMPSRNAVRSLKEYQEVYRRVGFQEFMLTDATKECWEGFLRSVMRWAWLKLRAGDIGPGSFVEGVFRWVLGRFVIRHYVLVGARKAETSSQPGSL